MDSHSYEGHVITKCQVHLALEWLSDRWSARICLPISSERSFVRQQRKRVFCWRINDLAGQDSLAKCHFSFDRGTYRALTRRPWASTKAGGRVGRLVAGQTGKYVTLISTKD
jgi:hypothetical protein